mgnify:CR=1 FL=1
MRRQKNLLLIILIIIIIVGAIILINKIIGKDKEEATNQIKTEEFTIESANGDKVNTSEALKKEREELGYYVSNITLERKDAQTVFKINLTNRSGENKPGRLVDIVFIGKDGQEEARMALYIREMNAGASIETQATINNDFTNVYDFRLEARQ